MDKNIEFPPYSMYGYDPSQDDLYGGFNPMIQYEQGYMYYRYMTQMLEYKMKLKEYEKSNGRDIRERRVE